MVTPLFGMFWGHSQVSWRQSRCLGKSASTWTSRPRGPATMFFTLSRFPVRIVDLLNSHVLFSMLHVENEVRNRHVVFIRHTQSLLRSHHSVRNTNGKHLRTYDSMFTGRVRSIFTRDPRFFCWLPESAPVFRRACCQARGNSAPEVGSKMRACDCLLR